MAAYMTISLRFSSWRDYHLSKKKETEGFTKKSSEQDGFLATNQEHFWSCDVRSKHLEHQHLQYVHCGIVSAAADLRITLDEKDLSWLVTHGGRFQMFIPLQSGQYKTKLASAQLKGKSAEAIAEHCLIKTHQVCGASPRFCRGSEVDNYHSSLETATSNL